MSYGKPIFRSTYDLHSDMYMYIYQHTNGYLSVTLKGGRVMYKPATRMWCEKQLTLYSMFKRAQVVHYCSTLHAGSNIFSLCVGHITSHTPLSCARLPVCMSGSPIISLQN